MFPTFISVEAPLSTSIATDATIEITIIYCYMTSLLRIKIDTTATTRAFPILSDLNRYIHVTANPDLAMDSFYCTILSFCVVTFPIPFKYFLGPFCSARKL